MPIFKLINQSLSRKTKQMEVSLANGLGLEIKSSDKCVFLSCQIHVLSKSALCNCLNVKKLFAQNRRHIWNLRDNNRTQTNNYLILKEALNYLEMVKWLSGRLLVFELSD